MFISWNKWTVLTLFSEEAGWTATNTTTSNLLGFSVHTTTSMPQEQHP
jgi:hypothetical protein